MVRHHIDEHWRASAIAAVHRYREADPRAWSDYLAEAGELAGADAAIDHVHSVVIAAGEHEADDQAFVDAVSWDWESGADLEPRPE